MVKVIGCCDSGLGGMITVDALHKTYPNLDIVFIADQKNAPYGEKSIEQLTNCAMSIFDKFEEMNINEVIVACNTLCCNGTIQAKGNFPQLNVKTIIQPTYQQLEGYDFKTINVLATQKTVETHVYQNGIKTYYPNALIREIPAPKIVPVIENGYDLNKLNEVVQKYSQVDADAWILGCTHYPLIRPFLKTNGRVFDSIQPILNFYKDEEITGNGEVKVYTTGDPDLMRNTIKKILGKDYHVEYIELKQF